LSKLYRNYGLLWKGIIRILDKTTIYFSKNTDLLFEFRIILYILSILPDEKIMFVTKTNKARLIRRQQAECQTSDNNTIKYKILI